MLRVELIKQLVRIRSLIALAALAAVPVAAGLGTASRAGGRDGSQGGLYGASPFSALNHAAASLQFVAPLLLALVVSLFGSALGAADRGWGTHPFHRIGAAPLSTASAAVRLLAGAGYVTVCVLSVGAIALCLGTLLPGPGEALGASVAFVVVVDGGQRQRMGALDHPRATGALLGPMDPAAGRRRAEPARRPRGAGDRHCHRPDRHVGHRHQTRPRRMTSRVLRRAASCLPREPGQRVRVVAMSSRVHGRNPMRSYSLAAWALSARTPIDQ